MSIVTDAVARITEIAEALKARGHEFGEELGQLARQLAGAEAPVLAEAEADVKQVGEDAVTAAEPTVEAAEADLTAAVEPAPAPEAPAAPVEETPAPAAEETTPEAPAAS
jgi:hypothetical protein